MEWVVVVRLLNGLIGLAVLVMICAPAIAILRWTGLSRPVPGKDTLSGPMWALIVYLLLVFGVVSYFRRSPPHLSGPAAAMLFLASLALPIAVLVFDALRQRDPTLARVSRLAARGDIAGAIIVLQAALDRDSSPTLLPAGTPAADPWAPPGAPLGRDVRRANRLNLMGLLHIRRGDWPAALGWFERADRVGGPRSAYRANIGQALVELGRDDEGFAATRAAIALVPEHQPLVRHALALALARTLLDRGRRDKAHAALDEAAEALRASQPFLPWTRSRLAREIEVVRARLPASGAADKGMDGGSQG